MPSQYKFLGISLKEWAVILLLFAGFMVLMDRNPAVADFVARLTDPSGPLRRSQEFVLGGLWRAASRVVSLDPVQKVLSVLLTPGAYAVDAIWVRLLGQTSNPFQQNLWVAGFFLFVAFWVPWVVWSIVLPRGFFYLGLWDPFARQDWHSRRWVLMGFVKLRETWEIIRHFGRRPTGGWASFIEVLSNRFLAGDVFLGRPKLVLGGMLRAIGVPTEKHMITIAGTGSGKSTAALIPNLCIHKGSLLCIDPKGELATITARRRGPGGRGVSGMGQAVHVLDPFGIVHGWRSSSYNVFDEMERVASYDPDRPVSYAGKIADALVLKSGSGDQKYWDDAAHTLLRGLILYIFVKEPKEQRNLGRLRDLLMEGDVEGHRQALKAGAIRKEDGLSPFDVLQENMLACREGPYGKVIAGTVYSLRQMGDRQMGGVVTTAQEHTSFLDAPELQRISAHSDFLLEDLKTGKTSVYLCLPIGAVTGKEGRWLRMFVLMLIDMMMRVQTAPKPPILLAIDEFPSLGKLDGIEAVAPVLRSYGVRFWAIAQDIEQLDKVYPGVWGGFVGGAEAVQFMGVTHPPTVAYIVERLGEHVVKTRVRAGGRTTWEEEERDLLDADQVARILAKDRKNQIIWRGSKKPMLLKTAPYFWYLPGRYYDRDPRYGEPLRHRVWRGLLWPRPKPLGPAPSGPPAPVVMAPPPAPAKTFSLQEMLNMKAPEPAKKPLSENIFMKELARLKAKPASSAGVTSEFSALLEKARAQADVPKPGAAPPKEPNALEELNAMVGLDAVKQEVGKLVNLMKLHARRKQHGMPDLTLSHHLVFTGNPGTGKTTVARLIGRIYKEFGVLKSGHVVEVDRGGLIASYTGQTPPKVMAVVEKALDGILFIDEAYSLTPPAGETDHYGAEAVATLLKAMEDSRERLAVIVAGYPEEMKRFISSNPGLESRFKTVIDFPDYSPDDLTRIFDNMCAAAGCRLSMAAREAVSDWLAMLALLSGGGRGFGNGRAVRNLFEDCLSLQAARLAAKADVSKVDVTMFEADDIPPVSKIPVRRDARKDEADGRDDTPPAPPVTKPPPETSVAKAPLAAAPAVSEEKIKEILSWSDEVANTARPKRGRPKKDTTET